MLIHNTVLVVKTDCKMKCFKLQQLKVTSVMRNWCYFRHEKCKSFQNG